MALFDGLQVIEISATGAAAEAGAQFAAWGADVMILEPPEGTPLRTAPPYFGGDNERSAAWEWLSRGKRSARVSVERARTICAAADVVLIESELTRSVLGLLPAEVRGCLEGRTICVLIAPFATDGPLAHYRASDLGLHARGGWMSRIGYADREPLRPGCDLMPRVTGIWAFLAALVALRHRRNGGPAQYVELCGQAVAAALIHPVWLTKAMNGLEMARARPSFPSAMLECADGYVGCSPLTSAHWELLCRMIGLEDVLDDPQGRDPGYRRQHGDALHARVRPWLHERTRSEIFAEAQTWGVPAAPVQSIAERLDCPQLAARGFFEELSIAGRVVRAPRVPYLIEGTAPVPRGPLQELVGGPPDRKPRPAPTAPRSPEQRPLTGVTVLDLTHFWAGPFATMLLSALGATVIKVESIQRPDGYRVSAVAASADRWYERGSLWNDTNNGKLGITLDLTSAEGKQLFKRLVSQADIVVSNFANRVMPNLGLNATELRALSDRLIVATLPGYGPGGPWENHVGYGFPFEQVSGCVSVTGYPDEPPLQMSGFVDPLAGVRAATALLLALIERDRTGTGTTVEVPQCEVVDALFAPEHVAVQLGAPVPVREANRHAWMAPHNAYRVAGADEWLTIAIASDAEFAAFAAVIGRPELVEDPRFVGAVERKSNEAALDILVGAALRDREATALEAELQAHGVMACLVRKAAELDGDEALQAMGFFQLMERPVTGTRLYKSWPWRFSNIATSHQRPAPLLGEHTREVLGSMLGLAEERLSELTDWQVIGTEPLSL